jgi:RecA-family ATPase
MTYGKEMTFGIEKQLDTIEDQKEIDAVWQLRVELARAEHKHPIWPADPIHQVAIMVEEAGEAMRAVLRLVYKEGGTVEELRKEIIQTGAMALRCLKNLEG